MDISPAWIDNLLKSPDWSLDNDPSEDAQPIQLFGYLPVGPTIPHLIRGVTVLARNPASVAAAAESAFLTAEEAKLLVNLYILYYSTEVLLQRQPDLVMSYVTYEKIHPVNHKVYVGRTAGRGVPLVVLARRDAAHASVRPDYQSAIMQSATTFNGLTFRGYAGMRGREQQAIDFHKDRSQSTDVWEFSGNAINGVSPNNPDALTYWLTSNADFGELSTYRAYVTTGEVADTQAVPLAVPFNRPPVVSP